MNVPFPFGLPGATQFYLIVYVVTLVIHVVFMNYVLAGTAYLAFVSIFTGGEKRRQLSPTAAILRDWMPFAVSAAITAGIAPVLFVQILYKEQFYTANLLLFHRWMAILPVLIVGFYMCYLLKSKVIEEKAAAWRTVVGLGAFACFAFTAYSWTENHLLSVDRKSWADFYGSSSIIYFNRELLPRLALWFTGAFPTLAMLVGWQVYKMSRLATTPATSEKKPVVDFSGADQTEARRLASLALIGVMLSAVSAVVYYALLPATTREAFFRPIAMPYFVIAAGGLLLQLIGWHFTFHRRQITAERLRLITAGVLATIIGMTAIREVIRLRSLDIASLYVHHKYASSIGGLGIFLTFFLLNAVLVAWCFVLVQRGMREKNSSHQATTDRR